MGGTVPLGYDARDHSLMVNAKEAATVRLIFRLYIELGTVRKVRDELDRRSIVSKQRVSKAGVSSGGVRFGRGALYKCWRTRFTWVRSVINESATRVSMSR
jgi:site-specific DNA recombinase